MKRKLAAVLAAALAIAPSAGAQSPPQNPTGGPDDTTGQATVKTAPGKVVLSRSIDSAPATAPRQPPDQAPAEAVTSAERNSITFTSYDLDVHLQPKEQLLAVRARVVLRNDGPQALRRIPLQISSSLTWTGAEVQDAPAQFVQYLVESDVDHTAALDEAVIALPKPLLPGETLKVDASYQGSLGLSTRRLEEIGTPVETAERSDWDRVNADFVGFRGFGDVVWYPVASLPVKLGDGDRFFVEVADQRFRQSSATLSMHVTEEFWGAAPNLAVLNGRISPVAVASSPAEGVPGIATSALAATRMGFASPSLFLLTRTETAGSGIRLFLLPQNLLNAKPYEDAAALLEPLMAKWLGKTQRTELTLVDLPEEGDASFDDGAVLFTPIGGGEQGSEQGGDPKQLAGIVVHSLAHARFQSPYLWLEEGVPYFMGTLWIEQEEGRANAIARMDNLRASLSIAEPSGSLLDETAARSSDVPEPGQSLLDAKDAVYYRTKAIYVLWMLREIVGDGALARGFVEYDPTEDTDGREFERVLERVSGKDLKWFFTDWVYRDRGLPDLAIAGVYPSAASIPGSYIVAVDVANNGNAAADVPVSVVSAAETVTEVLHVPAKGQVNHRFLLSGRPDEVSVNDGSVPEVEASAHQWLPTDEGQPSASRAQPK